MNDNRPQYRVKVYPNGEDRAEVWLKFESPEAQKQYVRDEYQHCLKEEKAHITAFYLKDRKRTKAALLKKRVEFAKKNGFLPAHRGSSTWEPEPTHAA